MVVVCEDGRDDEIHRNTHLYTKNGTDASDYQMTITLCDGVTMKTHLFQNLFNRKTSVANCTNIINFGLYCSVRTKKVSKLERKLQKQPF